MKEKDLKNNKIKDAFQIIERKKEINLKRLLKMHLYLQKERQNKSNNVIAKKKGVQQTEKTKDQKT